MGRWIDEQNKNNVGFTKSASWTNLKNVHEKVHGEVQNYIDKNAKRASNEELATIAKRIEDETLEVFEDLNGILESHCKYIKPENEVTIQPSVPKKINVVAKSTTTAPKIIASKDDDEWESF
jgi:methyl-accepting chemotaxis protein